jgi:hypothetical protein
VMKKLFKIIGVLLLLIVAILVAAPFILESKIDAIVKNYADNNLNADLSFEDISLSLIRSFPNAEVHVKGLEIRNRSPFDGETLATAKDIALVMPIKELLKGTEEALVINEISAEEMMVTLQSNKNGTTNYDILKTKETTPSVSSTETKGFSFDIQNYSLNNSAFTYFNEENNSIIYLTEVNHHGKGIFSGHRSELDTKTSAKVSLSVDSTYYLSNTTTKLDALIDLDLENNTYSFKDNRALVNSLPLEFEGFIKLVDTGQVMDFKFKNPESSFNHFLAVIPSEYADNLNDVNTSGDFSIDGEVIGLLSETTIPSFHIKIVSENAAFQYPDLPKKVEHIKIDAEIINKTGVSKDTYVDINAFNFKIDEDRFSSEAHIKDLGQNTRVTANFDGVVNLANLTKAYPVTLETQLSGILRGQLTTDFDMNAVQSNDYTRIKNTGSVDITNFIFSSEDFVNPIQINAAVLNFSPGLVTLKHMDAITGTSDLLARGTIRNLLGFLLSNKKLQGDFNVTSESFTVSDFMTKNSNASASSQKSTLDKQSLKIPDFLDCRIKADVQHVIYDNLKLKNVTGELRIIDQNAELINLSSDLFDGKLIVAGQVSTKEELPRFDLNLAMRGVNIAQSFEGLNMLKAIAPIANVLQGRLDTGIDVNGLLDSSFSPDLNTIAGNAEAKLMTTNVNTSSSPLLTGIANHINFIDLEALNLKDIETELNFKEGSVVVAPFTINYKDIPIQISGSHSFSNEMNYKAIFQVPAKYLGSDVNRLIGQINDSEIDKITIPVTALIDGTFDKPNIKTDLTSGVNDLTRQLVAIQKQKLVNKGQDNLNSLISDLLDNSKTDTVTTNTNRDSSKTKDTSPKTEVKSILGTLLSGKKKTKAEKAKDTTQKNNI